MDSLKINSRFMRAIVSKLVKKAIFKKTGYEVDVRLSELSIDVTDGKTYVRVNAEAEFENSEYKKFLKFIEAEKEL